MSYTSVGSLESMFREEPMHEAQRRTTERVGDDLQSRVKAHTPIAHPPPGVDVAEWEASRKGRLPGTLRESWEVGAVVFAGDRSSISVRTFDPIAPLVEWETRPHLIRPRPDRGAATVVATGNPRGTVQDGRAHLRFPGEDGSPAYAKEVHHPGTRGAHMMAQSLVEVAVSWRRIGEDEMARWAKEQLVGVGI